MNDIGGGSADSSQPGRRIRIAYLAHGVGGRLTGVRTKILSQASIWAELDPNVEVGVFVRCEAGTEADWRGQTHVVRVRSSRAGIIGRFVERERLSIDLARWRPDVIYLRQSTVSPSLLVLAGTIPTVIEMNTDDLEELRIRSKVRYWYARATRDRLLRRARGLVVVTHEIEERPSVRRLGRPTAVIPNSVDLAAYPTLTPTGNVTPRLAFLGSPDLPWHGLDRLEEMARHFPSWTFDVIGPTPRQFVHQAGNINLHGLLDPADYLPILARADVAIGPLALHRVHLSEASPLKVAEYLAYGLPVIVGYTDVRFPSGASFLLQIPAGVDGIETTLPEIEAFVMRWMGRRISREAIASIDSRVVERQRLDAIRRAIGSERPIARPTTPSPPSSGRTR